MKITVADGQQLAGVKKFGEPLSEWEQVRPNTFTNSFGVVDGLGQGIRGVHVELSVFITPRLGIVKYVFTLMRNEPGCTARAYQLDIRVQPVLKPADHNFPHEHYGTEREGRLSGDRMWVKATLDQAVNIFCEKCNLTLTGALPDYQAFNLQ
jgi:hypothetical protein